MNHLWMSVPLDFNPSVAAAGAMSHRFGSEIIQNLKLAKFQIAHNNLSKKKIK